MAPTAPPTIPKSYSEEIYKQNVVLLEQQRRYEQLLHGVSEAVFAVDSDFKITIFNQAAEKMLEIPATQAVGRQADDVVRLQDSAGAKIPVASFCFVGGSPTFTIENAVVTAPSGQRYEVAIKSSNITFSQARSESLVTLTDLTKEKEIERLKDEFLSIVSHELRTPMTIIKNYLWMIATTKGGELSPIKKEYVDKANKGVERMLNLVNDMLDVSRIDQGRVDLTITDVDLAALLKDVVEEFKIKTQEKGLYLKLDVGNLKLDQEVGKLEVRADEDKLREVIVNLLGNAAKFTVVGGITVSIKYQVSSIKYDNDNKNPTDILNTQYLIPNTVRVSVTDTGKGMSAEDETKLFHKFSRVSSSFTTSAETGGTGLGLYISKSLVEKMGGQIGVTSVVGQGSTFWFTLPVAV